MKIHQLALVVLTGIMASVVADGGGLRRAGWPKKYYTPANGGSRRRNKCRPTIVVANRNSGTVSILDAQSGTAIQEVVLPGDAEPVSCWEDVFDYLQQCKVTL